MSSSFSPSRLSLSYWNRPRWHRLSSRRAGNGQRRAACNCFATETASVFRRRSSARAATIFWPASFPRPPCFENIEGDIVIPDHPLIREVMKDVLGEAMDLEGLKRVLADMLSGRIRCVAVDTTIPSHFAHEMLNANPYAYLDDAPLEERRARAVNMRGILPDNLLGEAGRLAPEAIASVRE